ncbi:MAG: hypothetical protein ACK4WH_02290 [Phycisphaerales bacterium]
MRSTFPPKTADNSPRFLARPASRTLCTALAVAGFTGAAMASGPAEPSPRSAVETTVSVGHRSSLNAIYTPGLRSGSTPGIVNRGPGCPVTAVSRFRDPRPGFPQDFNFDNIQPGQEIVIQAGFAQQEIAAASFQIPDSAFPIKIEQIQAILGTVATVPTTTRYSVLVWDGTPPSNGGGALYIASSDSNDPASPPDAFLPAAPSSGGSTLAGAVLDIMFAVDDQGNLEDAWIIQPIGNPSLMHTITIGFRIDQHNNQTANPCFTAPPQGSNAFPCTEPGTCCTTNLLTFPNDNWLYGVNCGSLGCPPNGGMVRFSQLSANGCLAGFCTGCRPSGDWALRLKWSSLGCLPPTGSCCNPVTGGCIVNAQADCAATWTENGVCDPNPCPQPPGACCFTGGVCQSRDQNTCAGFGGTFLGVGTVCNAGACTTGACCFSNGSCIADLFPAQCAAAGGTAQAGGSSCSPNNCPQPTGACCLVATGFCALDTQANCTIPGTVWAGAGVPCSPSSCPSTGACCASNGFCSVETPTACGGIPGATFQGIGSTCSPNPCAPPSGACCCGSTCVVVVGSACTGVNQRYIGNNTVCNAPGVNTAPCCRADYNQASGITVQDIFDFLSGYFNTDSCADFNQAGGITVQDIFDFLSAYFAGGC